MQPLRREVMSEMLELIDTELDAVCGGLFDFGNIVVQPNIATQVGVAVGGISGITGGNARHANLPQWLCLLKFSSLALTTEARPHPGFLPGSAGTTLYP